jgi:hypothetical protein
MDDAKHRTFPAGPDERGHSSLAKRIVEGSTILTAVTALLFLTGWAYLGAYYECFNLDPVLLDLPTYDLLISAVVPVMAFFVVFAKPVPYFGIVVFAVVSIGTFRKPVPGGV